MRVSSYLRVIETAGSVVVVIVVIVVVVIVVIVIVIVIVVVVIVIVIVVVVTVVVVAIVVTVIVPIVIVPIVTVVVVAIIVVPIVAVVVVPIVTVVAIVVVPIVVVPIVTVVVVAIVTVVVTIVRTDRVVDLHRDVHAERLTQRNGDVQDAVGQGAPLGEGLAVAEVDGHRHVGVRTGEELELELTVVDVAVADQHGRVAFSRGHPDRRAARRGREREGGSEGDDQAQKAEERADNGLCGSFHGVSLRGP